MIPALSALPESFTAGDTVKVLYTLPAYPAPDWDLAAAFYGPEKFTINAAHDGTSHLLTIAAADTADKKPGAYQVQLKASASGEVVTVGTFRVFMLANADGGQLAWAEQMLALIEEHIKGRLPAGLTSHTINGDSIAKMSFEEAMKFRGQLRAEVESLRRAGLAGEGDSGAIYPYFER
jgi:hypothetical protein